MTFSSEINHRRGGPREKVTEFLLRGRMVFCYHVNRLLTVRLLSEIFTEQIVPKNAIFGLNSPPRSPVQVFVRSQTNATVSSLI